jgi:ssDNA-binding Zn-finger/Zn-ribbon topoisomerase 1
MGKFKQRVLLPHVRCPECGVPMMERHGAKGSFFGCSRFPLCIGTRPKGGEDDDSYTKLLRKSYVRAVRFLSSPRFMGFADAPRWLVEQAVGHAPTDDELEDFDATAVANEHLERAIDAACAWASERAGETVDFLVNEHEVRYASLRAKLIFVTTAEQIRRMPKAEIVRRYDMTDLSQFEAQIAGTFKAEGMYCPRCNGWSESKDSEEQTQVIKDFTQPMTEAELEALFSDDIPFIHKKSWECGRCGIFTKTTTRVGKDSTEDIEFANDANDPTFIKGVTFRVPARKEKPKLE